MCMFIILIIVVVSQEYKYGNPFKLYTLNIHSLSCQLCFNKEHNLRILEHANLWFSCNVDRTGTRGVSLMHTFLRGKNNLHEGSLAKKITHEELQMRMLSYESQADTHHKGTVEIMLQKEKVNVLNKV